MRTGKDTGLGRFSSLIFIPTILCSSDLLLCVEDSVVRVTASLRRDIANRLSDFLWKEN